VNGHLWRVTFVNPIKFDAALQRAVPLGPVGQGMSALKQLPDLKRARQVAKDWREALGA
jgi:hypothetical protein